MEERGGERRRRVALLLRKKAGKSLAFGVEGRGTTRAVISRVPSRTCAAASSAFLASETSWRANMCRVAMRAKVSTATATAALPGGAWRTPVFSDVGVLLDRRVLFPGVQGGVRGDLAPIARDAGYREVRVQDKSRRAGIRARRCGASGEREGRSFFPLLLTFDGSKINLVLFENCRAIYERASSPALRETSRALLFQTSNASSARSMARALSLIHI